MSVIKSRVGRVLHDVQWRARNATPGKKNDDDLPKYKYEKSMGTHPGRRMVFKGYNDYSDEGSSATGVSIPLRPTLAPSQNTNTAQTLLEGSGNSVANPSDPSHKKMSKFEVEHRVTQKRIKILRQCVTVLNKPLDQLEQQFRSSESPYEEIFDFIVDKALLSDNEFVFNNTRLAYDIMARSVEEDSVSLDNFLQYCMYLQPITDRWTAPRVFRELATTGDLKFEVFERYVTKLRQSFGYGALEWDRVRDKYDLKEGERLLLRASQVLQKTELFSTRGSLYLTDASLIFECEDDTMCRQISLKKIKFVKKVPVVYGFVSMDRGMGISINHERIRIDSDDDEGDDESTGSQADDHEISVVFAFPEVDGTETRDRWLDSVGELTAAHGLSKGFFPEDGDEATYLGNKDTRFVAFVGDNIVRIKCIAKATGRYSLKGSSLCFCTGEPEFAQQVLQEILAHELQGGRLMPMQHTSDKKKPWLSKLVSRFAEVEAPAPRTPAEPLDYKKLLDHAVTFLDLLEPIFAGIYVLDSLFAWRNPIVSLLAFIFNIYLGVADKLHLLPPTIMFANILYIWWYWFFSVVHQENVEVARQLKLDPGANGGIGPARRGSGKEKEGERLDKDKDADPKWKQPRFKEGGFDDDVDVITVGKNSRRKPPWYHILDKSVRRVKDGLRDGIQNINLKNSVQNPAAVVTSTYHMATETLFGAQQNYKVAHSKLQFAQTKLGLINNIILRIQSLYTWVDPSYTIYYVSVLTFLTVALLFVPFRFVYVISTVALFTKRWFFRRARLFFSTVPIKKKEKKAKVEPHKDRQDRTPSNRDNRRVNFVDEHGRKPRLAGEWSTGRSRKDS